MAGTRTEFGFGKGFVEKNINHSATSVPARINSPSAKSGKVSVAENQLVSGRGLKIVINSEPALGIAPALVRKLGPHANRQEQSSDHLTARETQILEFIAEGLHNQQMAIRINRSIKTVEKHRQNVLNKLHVHDIAGVTRYALASGLARKDLKSWRWEINGSIHFSPRQTQILKLIAQGLPNKAIAMEVGRSIKTVQHHRQSIMARLDIHEVAGLTRYAVAVGLVEDKDENSLGLSLRR